MAIVLLEVISRLGTEVVLFEWFHTSTKVGNKVLFRSLHCFISSNLLKPRDGEHCSFTSIY